MTVTPALLDTIRTRFLASPGLHMTLGTAARLWQLDPVVCDVALRVLIEEGFLMRTADERFCRPPAFGRRVA